QQAPQRKRAGTRGRSELGHAPRRARQIVHDPKLRSHVSDLGQRALVDKVHELGNASKAPSIAASPGFPHFASARNGECNHYSTTILLRRMISAYRARSLFRTAPNSSGVSNAGIIPCASSLSFNGGPFMLFVISAQSRRIVTTGVPAGAVTPNDKSDLIAG